MKKMCKWYFVCPMKYYADLGKIDKSWIENYCEKNGRNCVRYQKEESGIYHPDNMLPNGEIDENLS
jgi:hypothetical protein